MGMVKSMVEPAERDQILKLVGAAVYPLADMMNFEQAQVAFQAAWMLTPELVAYQRPHPGLLPLLPRAREIRSSAHSHLHLLTVALSPFLHSGRLMPAIVHPYPTLPDPAIPGRAVPCPA